MKKVVIYSLVSALSLGVAGSAVYATMDLADRNSTNKTNNQQGNNNDPTDPTLPSDDPDENNTLSKMVNRLLTVSELKLPSVALTLTSVAEKPIYFNLTDTAVDMADAMKGNINFSTSLNVKYDSIDETLNLALEDTGFAYVSYRSHNYAFSAPKTINGVMDMLKACGIAVPDLSGGTASIDTSALLEKAQGLMTDILKTESVNGTTTNYTVHLDDFTKDKTTISNFDLVIAIDNTDYSLTGIATKNNTPIKINDIGLNLSATCTFLEKSTYAHVNTEDYQDLTGATDSILSTVTKIVGEKKTNVGLELSLETTDSKTKAVSSSTITGLMQADVSSAGKDFSKGVYSLSLAHPYKDDTASGDQIDVQYGNETTYIKIDNLFAGKVTNSSISTIFDSVSSATDDKSFKGISDELEAVLGQCDLTTLLSGDTSVYTNFVKSFTYQKNQGFTLEINAKAFGLGDYTIAIVLSVTEGTDDVPGKIVDLQVNNLQYQGIKASIKLTPEDFTAITPIANRDAFKDYKAVVPLYQTVSDLMKNKQVAATYSLLYTSSKETYSGSGSLAGDMSQVTSFKSMASEMNKGSYHFDFATTFGTTTHKIDATYQDHSLYFGYDNGQSAAVFKNSLTDVDLASMVGVVSGHSGTDSDPQKSMDDILGAVSLSPAFNKDLELLKQGYISGLSSFVSIDKDNTNTDQMIVVLDTDYVLAETQYADKVGKITLKINTDDKALTSIDVTGLLSGTSSLSFTLNLGTYNTDYLLADDAKALYTPIENASQLLSSFYNLPTDLKKFGLTVDGSVIKDQKTMVEATGVASVDVSDADSKNAFGTMTIKTPSLADSSKLSSQKVEFDYQDDSSLSGQFVAEYNDTMHIQMHTATVGDIFNQINTEKDNPDNVLVTYLNGMNTATSGLPIEDAIKNKNYSALLDKPYIKSLVIGSSSITLTIDGTILNPEDTTGAVDTLKVSYDPATSHITSASVNAVYNGMTIAATLGLSDYKLTDMPDMLLYSDTTKDQFLDLDGFAMLVSCGIDTTENNTFTLSGNVDVNALALSGLNIGLVSTKITAKLYVENQKVDIYLSFNNGSKKITDKGFYATEFFFNTKDDALYVDKTTNTASRKADVADPGIQSEVFKTTKKNLTDNILYYALDYVLDVSDINFGKVALANVFSLLNKPKTGNEETASAVTLGDDFSSLITKIGYHKDQQYFGLDLDLNSFLSLGSTIKFENTSLALGYTTYGSDSEYTPLSAFNLSTGLDVYAKDGDSDPAVSAKIRLSFGLSSANYDLDSAKSYSPMSRYFSFIDSYEKDYAAKPVYLSNGIKEITKTWYNVANDYTLDDNAALAKTYFTTYDANSIYFYKD